MGAAVVDISSFRTDLQVDNERFLKAIFETEWERAHVCAFREDPHDLDALGLRHYWAGGPAWKLLPGMTPDENQYFTISLFSGDRRRKTQHEATYCIVLDDVGIYGTAKVPWDRVKLPPSWILETSPGNYQVGYILSKPETRAGKASGLLDALVDWGLCSGGKDPGMKGVTRYVRLPGGTNRKKAYGDTGFRHRMVLWNPGQMTDILSIARAYGVEKEVAEAPDDLGGYAGTKKVPVAPGEDLWLGVLSRAGRLKQELSAGVWDVECPFIDEHTARADSGCAYLGDGGFKCHHGHCESRPSAEFREKLRQEHPGEFEDARREQIEIQFGDIGGSRDPFEGLREGVGEQVEKLARIAAQGKFGGSFWAGDLVGRGLAPRGTNWLLKNLFPREGVAALYGAPKTGKTFVAVDLAMRVGAGMDWHGHRVKRDGFVYYVAAEGGTESAENRALAWLGEHPGVVPRVHFYAGTVRFGVGAVEDAVALVREIERVGSEAGAACVLVVMDTLNQTMVGDENSTQDMSEYLSVVKKISEKLGCLVLLVHHSGKDASKGMRGSSALLGAVEGEIELSRDKDLGITQPGVISLSNLRHAEDGKKYGFQLKRVVLGVDEDLEDIATLVADACPPPAKKPRMTAKKGVILTTLEFEFGGNCGVDALVDRVAADTGRRKRDVKATVEQLISEGVLVAEGNDCVSIGSENG